MAGRRDSTDIAYYMSNQYQQDQLEADPLVGRRATAIAEGTGVPTGPTRLPAYPDRNQWRGMSEWDKRAANSLLEASRLQGQLRDHGVLGTVGDSPYDVLVEGRVPTSNVGVARGIRPPSQLAKELIGVEKNLTNSQPGGTRGRRQRPMRSIGRVNDGF